jgi:glycosyltransferase involved in cell wall biosynthesis
MPSLTSHSVVKNEEHFIGYALRSVLPFVDTAIVFDTGSTDNTVAVVEEVAKEFPGKIIFEKKGPADKARHTTLRQEMIERTTTDWFMILDGDEVWTDRGMEESKQAIKQAGEMECLISPFYLCVGDIFHASSRGAYTIRGSVVHATPRFFKRAPGLRWSGEYNHDAVVDAEGQNVFEKDQVRFLKEKFWHVSHLLRSSKDDAEYSSGNTRGDKRRLTHLFLGTKITEPVPEVFLKNPSKVTKALSFGKNITNFGGLLLKKMFS